MCTLVIVTDCKYTAPNRGPATPSTSNFRGCCLSGARRYRYVSCCAPDTGLWQFANVGVLTLVLPGRGNCAFAQAQQRDKMELDHGRGVTTQWGCTAWYGTGAQTMMPAMSETVRAALERGPIECLPALVPFQDPTRPQRQPRLSRPLGKSKANGGHHPVQRATLIHFGRVGDILTCNSPAYHRVSPAQRMQQSASGLPVPGNVCSVRTAQPSGGGKGPAVPCPQRPCSPTPLNPDSTAATATTYRAMKSHVRKRCCSSQHPQLPG